MVPESRVALSLACRVTFTSAYCPALLRLSELPRLEGSLSHARLDPWTYSYLPPSLHPLQDFVRRCSPTALRALQSPLSPGGGCGLSLPSSGLPCPSVALPSMVGGSILRLYVRVPSLCRDDMEMNSGMNLPFIVSFLLPFLPVSPGDL